MELQKKNQVLRRQKGQILLFSLILMSTVILMMGALFSYLSSQIFSHRTAVAKEQALNLAEGGIEMALWKLNNQNGYTGETNTALGNGTFDISITTVDASKKTISVTGYVPNSSKPIASRTVKINTSVGISTISFRYGIQAGNGGFIMSGGSTLNGNIYSNGNISATSGVHITGSAVAANPPTLAADQTNDLPSTISSCTSSTCITFANASSTEDFSQQFAISSATQFNNIQFYIKKVGLPSDATVKIVTDNAGVPGTTILMSGTLSASLVTTNFGWATVSMPSNPVLDPSQDYWMVIDASSNNSKYYVIGANSGGYVNGAAKIGKYGGSWSNTSPSGLDGYFRIYLGGGTSMIGGDTYTGGVFVGTAASDDAWAHTVQGATVTGTIYCQTGSFTNKTCNTTRDDPTPESLPLSDANIQDWKDDAVVGGTITGDYHVGFAGASLGPKKITGNLLVDGGGTLTVTGTLWVVGTITVTGGGKVKLDPAYGPNSGAVVSDSYVILNGGCNFSGSGQAGSYPFLITTSACPAAAGCAGNNAITLSGGAGTVALIAQNGNITINGGSSLKQVTAKQITMSGGATLYYDSGLISENFSSGPGGSWEFMSGTYIITK
ncbi:hypothetical protein KW786_03020 [Candidatus Parcubacteria bacterium]|nr:hypothetical protein [Candidatus Parcubacteria bacterium]